MKTISIITPCYNEEDAVAICHETVKKIFEQQLPDYKREHIFCDNCSTDKTVAKLKEIAAQDPDVKIIVNSRNFGILKNTFNGVVSSTGDATILFLPVDLQDPPELIPDFVKLWQAGYEIVYGIRAEREEGFIMKAFRKLYYRILNKFSYIDYQVDVGDYQLVDKRIVDLLKKSQDRQPFLRMMTFDCGFKSVGIPYTWKQREIGLSKNRLSHLFDQGMNGLVSYTTIPLRLSFVIGACLFTFSLFYILFIVYSHFFGDQSTTRGMTTVLVMLFFFGGLQMLFVGLLGEYIHAIYDQVRNRPLVIERERINFETNQDS